MELNRVIRNHNAQIRRRVPEGVSGAAQAFVALGRRGVSAARGGRAGMTLGEASKALAASHAALAELARRSQGQERVRYRRMMDVVLAELKAVVQQILNAQGRQYRVLTDDLRSAAADLENAYQRARQTISHLNNATELLTAFGSLVSALR